MENSSFFESYNLLNTSDRKHKIIWLPKKCRFCGLGEAETTFKLKAHALSELLGANDLISYDECDICNKYFSKYESHFSKYYLPHLTMVGVKGKTKIPSFHSRTENNLEQTRTILNYDTNNTIRELLLDNNSKDVVIDTINNTAKIIFRKPPLIPIYVYKTLIKYGISLMFTRTLKKYSEVCNWLLNTDTFNKSSSIVIFPTIMSTTILNQKFGAPFAQLFERKENTLGEFYIPDHVMILCFGDSMLQVALPIQTNINSENFRNNNFHMPIYPNPYSNDRCFIIDLSSSEKESINDVVHLSYDNIQNNIGNG